MSRRQCRQSARPSVSSKQPSGAATAWSYSVSWKGDTASSTSTSMTTMVRRRYIRVAWAGTLSWSSCWCGSAPTSAWPTGTASMLCTSRPTAATKTSPSTSSTPSSGSRQSRRRVGGSRQARRRVGSSRRAQWRTDGETTAHITDLLLYDVSSHRLPFVVGNDADGSGYS